MIQFMKAIVIHGYGGTEVLKYEDYPDPVPGAGEVVVKVAAASVNPFDFKIRSGSLKDFIPITFPTIPKVQVKPMVFTPDPTLLLEMADAVQKGAFSIPLGQKFALADACKAHATAEKGSAGKILLLA